MALSNPIQSPIRGKPTENGQIPEDDLPRMAKSQRMTYRDWPNPGFRQAGISKEDLMNQQTKAIFRGRVILACRKPELIGIFKLTFAGTDKHR
jgi:hypothetical protein